MNGHSESLSIVRPSAPRLQDLGRPNVSECKPKVADHDPEGAPWYGWRIKESASGADPGGQGGTCPPRPLKKLA